MRGVILTSFTQNSKRTITEIPEKFYMSKKFRMTYCYWVIFNSYYCNVRELRKRPKITLWKICITWSCKLCCHAWIWLHFLRTLHVKGIHKKKFNRHIFYTKLILKDTDCTKSNISVILRYFVTSLALAINV